MAQYHHPCSPVGLNQVYAMMSPMATPQQIAQQPPLPVDDYRQPNVLVPANPYLNTSESNRYFL